MIPFTWQEELSRKRVYDTLDSRETFKVIGVVSSREFSDPMYRWQSFSILCRSSEGCFVLAKEIHQFSKDCFSEPFSKDSFCSLDLIDLTQEEAVQFRFLIKHPLEDTKFQKPPLII